jgi:hypothetical protein
MRSNEFSAQDKGADMELVVGIFTTRAEAESAITQLKSAGIPGNRINLLTPGASEKEIAEVPVSDTEQAGMGEAIGGVVGGAVGAAGGLSIGAAAASILVPGIGPVLAIGILSAALLGAGGAVGGALAGKALEEGMAQGLPVDELFVYEDALRQGRSVVIVLTDKKDQVELSRRTLSASGAESIDSARENWWIGLRDAEEEHYSAHKDDFGSVEPYYRRGFEAALLPQLRGRSYDDAVNFLSAQYSDIYREESFRRGYSRGQAYYQRLIGKDKSATTA